MAAVSIPTKFVLSPNSHLFCKICNSLFREPVINVKCGHTFCRECIHHQSSGQLSVKCPQDQVTCELAALVVNRSVKSQIEDLDIYCRHGLQWCDEAGDYIQNATGCRLQLKYSLRREHEDVCEFALVPCPNNETLCGRIRRGQLSLHLNSCHQYQCQYKQKGCSFRGSRAEAGHHVTLCGYRGLQPLETDQIQIQNLVDAKVKLEGDVCVLTERVAKLEQERSSMSQQLQTCLSQISELREEQRILSDRIEIIPSIRRSPSSPTPTDVRVKPVSRSSSVPSSPTRQVSQVESWMMPFQFKCIGTLRSHKAGVLALCTHKSILFSAGADCVIKIWGLGALEHGCRQTIEGHTDKIHCLTAEQFLYSAGADMSIRAWDLTDHTQAHIVEDAHENIIVGLVCTKDYVFSSSHTIIKVWDASTLRPLHAMSGLKHWVRCLVLNPNKDLLYSGSHNTIEIWDATGKFNLKGKISHTYGSVHCMAITQRYIVAGTYNNNTHVFDVVKQSHVHKLSGHVGTVQSVAATKSGKFFFSCSTDSKIQLWSLENFLPIQPLSRHEDSVNVITIHNDLLLSGSDDSEIKMFKYFKMQMGFIPS